MKRAIENIVSLVCYVVCIAFIACASTLLTICLIVSIGNSLFGQPFQLDNQEMMPLTTVPSAASYTYQTETLAYGTAITNNGGTISASDFLAVDTFVTNAKTNGYWPYLVDCSPLAGNNTNSAFIKLISPLGLNSITNKNFVASDYNRTNGLYPTGGNKWLNVGRWTSFNVSGAATNGLSIFLLNYQPVRSGPEDYAGDDGTGFAIYAPSGSDYIRETASYGNLSLANYHQEGPGMVGFTCPSPYVQWSYVNGMLAEQSTLSNSITTINKIISIYSGANGNAPVTNRTIGWYAIDSGMPTNYVQSYFIDVCRLMNGLGRIPTAPQQYAFLVNGQSLGVGTDGTPLYSTDRVAWSMNPGVESVGQSSTYRNTRNYFYENTVETGWRAFGSQLYSLCSNSVLNLNWARGGALISQLSSNATDYNTLTLNGWSLRTNNFWFSVYDMSVQQYLQTNLFRNNLLIPAMLMVHGESDGVSTTYSNDLTAFKTSYETVIKSITGQTNSVPIFNSQHCGSYSYPYTQSPVNYFLADLAMLTLHEVSNGSNILVMPKYSLTHYTDGTHLTSKGYDMMGEYYANAVYQQIFQGQSWSPLRPTNVAILNSNITITFDRGNLVWDTSLVSARPNYGFRFISSTSDATNNIASVSLAGAATNQVVVTLTNNPTGTGWTIQYGTVTNGLTSTSGGPVLGLGGNLRDQSTSVGYSTTSNLFNWCVLFSKSTTWP